MTQAQSIAKLSDSELQDLISHLAESAPRSHRMKLAKLEIGRRVEQGETQNTQPI